MTLVLNGTNGLSDVDGSAATPAIRGTDANTGIFFPAADTIAFSEGGAEAMRIDSSGNVGIGTTSPASKLDVGGAGGLITLHRSTDGNATGKIGSRSGSDFSFYNDGGSTSEVIVGGGSVNFNVGATERMRIDSSGNLLVGTTTVPSTTGIGIGFMPGYSTSGVSMVTRSNTTSANDVIYFYNPNGLVGYIRTSGSATSYVTSSDYRLKENVAPMSGALAVVQQLKPCTYTWKADGSDGQGFIAHELQAVVPECVTGEKDAVDADGNPQYQGIDTSFLVATLTAAIQELKALVDTQAERIAVLEAKP